MIGKSLQEVVNSYNIGEEKLVFAQSPKGTVMLLYGGHKYVLVSETNGEFHFVIIFMWNEAKVKTLSLFSVVKIGSVQVQKFSEFLRLSGNF